MVGPGRGQVSPPAGPSSLLPIAPGFGPAGVPQGPRVKDNRSWAERTAARAAEQAEAEVERERRAVREADQQEMLRRKEEEDRKNQPLGGKEWNERIKALEDRKQERARLALGGEPGERSTEGTPDVEMKQEPSPLASPARQSNIVSSPAVEAPVAGPSAIHPSRRGFVQGQDHLQKTANGLPTSQPVTKPVDAISTSLAGPSRRRSPSPAARQPSYPYSTSVAPSSTSTLPVRPSTEANHDRLSISSAAERKPSVLVASQSRERSPRLPELSRADQIQRDKERAESARIDDYLGRLIKVMPPVDLNKMWGGPGKIQSDAEVSHRSLLLTDRNG